VRLSYLLNVINAIRVKGFDLSYVDPRFLSWAKAKARQLGLSDEMFERELNVGFSGGERKRSEVLQVLAMSPRYAIFDEPDSGLDVDGIKVIGEAIAEMKRSGVGVLVITHQASIADFVRPDRAYVLNRGRIVSEGDYELVRRVLKEGYESFLKEVS